jgi:hypothetical protein
MLSVIIIMNIIISLDQNDFEMCVIINSQARLFGLWIFIFLRSQARKEASLNDKCGLNSFIYDTILFTIQKSR